MGQLSVLSELKRFSIAEKIIIVEELWDSIAADQESFGLTGEQRNELDRRVADYYSYPDDGYSWEDVKNRIRSMTDNITIRPKALLRFELAHLSNSDVRNSEKTHYPACAGCKKPLRLIFALLANFHGVMRFFRVPKHY